MGSPPGERGREAEETAHSVTISRPFYLGATEVTQGQWERVMGSNPSHFRSCGPGCPVEEVSWYDVQAFIARLDSLTSRRFRLPTEAEWEYACRAGTTTPFSTGSDLTPEQANYDAEGSAHAASPVAFRRSPAPVASFAANAFGLFDLHGNVWEWTSDDHCPYPGGPVADPVANCSSEEKVIRGGSWYFDRDSARCALRYTHRPQDRGPSLGFRLARR